MNRNNMVPVFAAAGVLIGGLMGIANPDWPLELAFVSTALLGMLGTILDGLRAALSKTARKRRRATARRRPVEQTAQITTPFRQRLAKFTHQNEFDVMPPTETYKSKMPFWSALVFMIRVPPKSAQTIGDCLLLIRRTIRRRPNRLSACTR